ncbi:hypothetical protein KN1_23970 [Stygiolobus caldivivus]|uniref:MFS transporter n=1 Tax=Stygiolobus caldivivus TaxID=2824673 RepID=A0A8D5ZK77_9CREN|nr:hypothetical protein KN1_23970 [Stygiolobus caldivivus]
MEYKPSKMLSNTDVRLYFLQHFLQPVMIISTVFPAYLFLQTKNPLLVGVLLSISYVLGHLSSVAGFLTDYIVNTRRYDLILSLLSGTSFLLFYFLYRFEPGFIFLVYTVIITIHSFKGTNHVKVLRNLVNSASEYRVVWITVNIVRTASAIVFLYLTLFVIGLRSLLLVLGLFMLLIHTPLIFKIKYPKGTGSAKLLFSLSISVFKKDRAVTFFFVDTLFANFIGGLLPVFLVFFAQSYFFLNYMVYYSMTIAYSSISLLIFTKINVEKYKNNLYYIFIFFRGLIPVILLVSLAFVQPQFSLILILFYWLFLTLYSSFISPIFQVKIPKEVIASYNGLLATLGSIFGALGNILLSFLELLVGQKDVVIVASFLLLGYIVLALLVFKNVLKQ